jgi:hypothetical protein
LVTELLGPLAERGLRLLLAYRRRDSPAWDRAQERWPDHDLADDDRVVLARRLNTLAVRIIGLAAAEEDVTRRRAEVAARIAGAPELSGRAATLRLRLSGLRRPAPGRDRRETRAALDRCETAADGALRAVNDLAAQLDALVERQRELRGRLGAYQAEARALGLVEDIDLGERFREAHLALWRAPCDLDAAAAAVARYEDAVRARGER